jgi:hypothetical protein
MGRSQTLRRSLENSSIKALSKIVKSSTCFQKFIWTCALVLGICAVIYQLHNLIIRYFSYATTINIVSVDGTPPFPDITLCHMNPNWTYTMLRHELQGNKSIRHFYRKVKNLQKLYHQNTTEFLKLAEIHSFAGYIQNVDHIHSRLEYLKELLVVDCLAYPKWMPVPCYEMEPEFLKTTLFIDPMFGFCVTHQFNNSKTIRSLKFLLYVQDDAHSLRQFDLSSESTHHTSMTGVRVVMHPAETFPDIWLKSELVLAGHDAEFKLSGTYLTHLKPPHGDCTEEEEEQQSPDASTVGIFNTDRSYGFECYRLCARDRIYENCGCVNIYYSTSEADRAEGKLCGVLDDNNTSRIFERMRCALLTELSLQDFETQCQCSIPCQHFKYDHKLKTQLWPHETYHLSFYERYVKGKPYARDFEVYEDLLKLSKTKPERAMAKLHHQSLIRDNFVQIRILNHQSSYPHYSDNPLVSIESLFGNMGGLLNLWVGITFITLVEIVDLVHQLYSQNSGTVKVNGTRGRDREKNAKADEFLLATFKDS